MVRMRDSRIVYRMLVGESLGKRLQGRRRRKWEDNTEKDFMKIGCENGSGWNWLRIGSCPAVLPHCLFVCLFVC